MVRSPEFSSLEEMNNSQWLANVRQDFDQNRWPAECVRCSKSEEVGAKSIRQHAIDMNLVTAENSWLQVGGILDNVCNAACQTCSEAHSTFLGVKKGNKIKVNNLSRYFALPQEMITHLDLNGGEPSHSKNYKAILKNPPPNLTHLRLNTNGANVMYELMNLVDRGIDVTVTMSLDGISKVHEYLRWPLVWDTFVKNMKVYRDMPINLNCWTTVSALNICDFNNIVDFAKNERLDHSWAFLEYPSLLSVSHTNDLTLRAKTLLDDNMSNAVAIDKNNQEELMTFIRRQDNIRGIKVTEYLDCGL